MSPDLEKELSELSEAATQGEWKSLLDGVHFNGKLCVSCWMPRKVDEAKLPGESWLEMRKRTDLDRKAVEVEANTNAAFIVSLVNAYRNGSLVPAGRVEELEGYKQQDSAGVVDDLIKSELFRLEGEVARLREALKFYADPAIYVDGPSLSENVWCPYYEVLADDGNRARAALNREDG